MSSPAKEIKLVDIEEELKQSYLDYAMSVIVGRALPDVRDGLKPVHRRVLYAMRELGNDHTKPYKKSARIVGDVIGKYHPHGDAAVYKTIVRLAQPFAMRYLLVDGQGNFGSVDGDAAAAMRYTEVRMSRITQELLADLDKETVNFVPNYDDTETAPEVLPTKLPQLLIGGSGGIAVGMATNIPPHNLTEVLNACLAVLETPDIEMSSLLEHISGPDFPTGGLIVGRQGIAQAYQTGRGQVVMRSRCEIQPMDKGEREMIVVTEIPYQVNKARLIERIAELVKEKKLEDISDLRDESDKDGIRIVIELRKGAPSEVVLNNLYAQTPMQQGFDINMVALTGGYPKLMNLKSILLAFLEHRREVVTRRSLYLLRKARERAHVLEGLSVASANIDKVVKLIRAAASAPLAKEELMKQAWPPGDTVSEIIKSEGLAHCRPDGLLPEFGIQEDGNYRLSDVQAQAILDLRLHRLTGLEQQKIKEEFAGKVEEIKDCLDILENPDRLEKVIRDELIEVRGEYGDERRTEIIEGEVEIEDIDLIPEEKRVISVTRGGYVLSQSLDEYRVQNRGGVGVGAASVKEEDLIQCLLVSSSHDTLLCFSNLGRVYWLPVYKIPQMGRRVRGRPLVNLLRLRQEESETITAILPLDKNTENKYILMTTALGRIKRVSMSNFSRQRQSGLRAVSLREGDHLIGVQLVTDDDSVMLFSDGGRCSHCRVADIRPMGRTASGVRGIRLKEGGSVVSVIVPEKDALICVVSWNGYGKLSRVEDFAIRGRGGKGVIAIKSSERNGKLVAAEQMSREDEMILITDQGTLLRTRAEDLPTTGRNTQGVRIIRLREGERMLALARINASDIS